MAKHGMVVVLKVMVAIRTVPASLTENQARKYVLRVGSADGRYVASHITIILVHVFVYI